MNFEAVDEYGRPVGGPKAGQYGVAPGSRPSEVQTKQ